MTDQAYARQIGRRLKALREREGTSLRAVAAVSGLSASFIGLVERGATEIAVGRLMKLADAYGVTVADLLADQPVMGDVRLHASLDEARQIDFDDGRFQVAYIPTSVGFAQPFRVVMHPGARLDPVSHATAEYYHCVEGEPTFLAAGQEHPMREGDTVFVLAGLVHAWRNHPERECLLVGAVERGQRHAATDATAEASARRSGLPTLVRGS